MRKYSKPTRLDSRNLGRNLSVMIIFVSYLDVNIKGKRSHRNIQITLFGGNAGNAFLACGKESTSR